MYQLNSEYCIEEKTTAQFMPFVLDTNDCKERSKIDRFSLLRINPIGRVIFLE